MRVPVQVIDPAPILIVPPQAPGLVARLRPLSVPLPLMAVIPAVSMLVAFAWAL